MTLLFAKLINNIHKSPPALAVFGITLGVYSATAAPDLTMAFNSGDGAELITAVITGGIPHPPGYPTYLLLGKTAALLPLEPIAYRFSMFSAICGAAASAATSAASRSLGLKGWGIVMPGFVLAFILLVWQQAVVTEVYSLNLAMVALFVWSLLAKKPSWLIGLLLGLSLTTHLTSALLLPLPLLFLPKHQLPRLSMGLIFGLTPYFLLPWLTQPESPVVWGKPQTVAGWWWLVSAQIYHNNQLALPVEKIVPRLLDWGNIWLQQLLVAGWLLLPWSCWRAANKKQWWALVGTAVAYMVYAFFYDTNDALVLTLPAWLLLSLSLTAAFKQLGNWSIFLPFALVLLNFSQIDRVELHNIRPFAEQILNNSPSDSVLVTSGDPDIFVLWYFHFVEGQRKDIIVIDDQLFAFDWYRNRLRILYPELQGLTVDDMPAFRALNAGRRPICDVVLVEAGELLAKNSCVKES